MVRPRLVEEGTPLGDWISSDDENEVHDDDTEGAMEMDHHGSAVTRSMASRPSPRPAAMSSDNNASPPSSLLRALGGKLPTYQQKVPKRAMKFEIGGDINTKEQEMMQYDPAPSEAMTTHSSMASWNNNNTLHSTLSHQTSHSDALHSASSHRQPYSMATTTRTHYEVGADYRPTERMEGVEDHSVPLPLVVVDGANVAYAYAHAREEHFHRTGRVEPDVRGLSVVCSYFSHIRVRVVLPASFMRAKPRYTDSSRVNAHMETDRFEILQQLQRQGKLVASPPADDDDAYCLTIAQRENVRALQTRQGQAPAFVLSNDMFRDAQERDASGQLKEWLVKGDRPETGPGRISYTFVDLNCKDDYGDPMFDLVPNPRHPLIAWIEDLRKQQGCA